jgi:hypothetical protein
VSLSLQPQLLRALTLIIILPNSAYFGAKPSNSCISANYINKNTRFQPRVFLGYKILITTELFLREVIKIHVWYEWQLHSRVILTGKKNHQAQKA